MSKVQVGELWIHRRKGEIFLVKELYTIDSNPFKHDHRDGLWIVKAIRLSDGYVWQEPLGMWSWEYKRLN